jgi:transcriptional regulator with XRE-family HTH domain
MTYRFGDKIRAVRERKGLTMKHVAAKAGLSESLISQIERNRVSPAIDTLLAIVEILDIDLDYLFRDFKRERAVNLVRLAERRRTTSGGVLYERLSHTVAGEEEHAMAAYLITVPPGGKSSSDEYGHPGRELGVILAGKAELAVGTQTIGLASGDSVSFPADVPHGLVNKGKGPLTALWVTTPPKRLFKD